MSGVTKPSVLEELAVKKHEEEQQQSVQASSPASAQPIEDEPSSQVAANDLKYVSCVHTEGHKRGGSK